MRGVTLIGGPVGTVAQQLDWMHQALREIEKASRVDEVTASTLKAIFTALTVLTAVDKADLVAGYDTSAALPVKFTVEDLFKELATLTALTAPAVGDLLAVYDLSATAPRQISLADLFKVIGLLTAETAPDVADGLPLWDASAGTTDLITLPNLFKVINGLTDDPALDSAADFGSHYDASAGDVKKHLIGRRIMQVVQVNTGTQTSVTGVTFSTTAVAATITPKNAANSILVLVSGVLVSGTTNAQAIAKLRRAGVDLPPRMLSGSNAGTAIAAGAITYLDAPATVSATTYDIQVASDTVGASAQFPFNANSATGTITLIELAP